MLGIQAQSCFPIWLLYLSFSLPVGRVDLGRNAHRGLSLCRRVPCQSVLDGWANHLVGFFDRKKERTKTTHKKKFINFTNQLTQYTLGTKMERQERGYLRVFEGSNCAQQKKESSHCEIQRTSWLVLGKFTGDRKTF